MNRKYTFYFSFAFILFQLCLLEIDAEVQRKVKIFKSFYLKCYIYDVIKVNWCEETEGGS